MSAVAAPRKWCTAAAWSVLLWIACFMLSAGGESHLGCASDVVKATLTSMLRDRVTQTVADGLPESISAARRLRLAKATWIAMRDPRLIEWEKGVGRLHCVAGVVIDARLDDRGAYAVTRTDMHYRVARSDADTVLVEVAYADLVKMLALPKR